MYRIDLPHLCWAMENLVEGKVVNQIKVDEHTTRKWALVALERMLDIAGGGCGVEAGGGAENRRLNFQHTRNLRRSASASRRKA